MPPAAPNFSDNAPEVRIDTEGATAILLARQSAPYLLGRVAPALVNLGALAVFTRLLTPEEYGLYAVVMAWSFIGFATTQQWLCVATVRFFELTTDRAALRGTLLAAFLGTMALVGTGCAIAAFFLARSQYLRALLFAFVLFALQSWLEINLHLLSAALMARSHAWLSIVRSLGSAIFGSTFVLADFGSAGALSGAVLGMLIPGAWCIGRNEWRSLRADFATIREILIFGLPLGMSFSLGGLLQQGDRVLLGWLATPQMVGIYAVATDLAERALRLFVQPFGMAGLPLAVRALERGGIGAARRQLQSNGIMLLSIGMPCAVGLAILAPVVCPLVLGAEFEANVIPLLRALTVATLFSIVRAYYLDHAFHLSRRTKLFGAVMLAITLTSLVLNFWLIPIYAAMGAATAAICAHGLGLVLGTIVGARAFPLPLPWDQLGKLGIASATMALVLWMLPAYHTIASLGTGLAVGALVYAMVMLLLNARRVRNHLLARHRHDSRPC